MVKKIDLNNEWYYSSTFLEGAQNASVVDGFVKVNLPHANVETPYNYFDEKMYQIVSCYKKSFLAPELVPGQVAKIRFEGVMTYAVVYLDGTYLGEHKGGYTPFEFEMTALLMAGKWHDLTVVVDSTEREDIPPFGGQIDYLTYGGIYREVSIDVYEAVHIENAQVKTLDVLNPLKKLEIDLYLENRSVAETQNSPGKLEVVLRDLTGKIVYDKSFVLMVQGGASNVTISCEVVAGVELWHVDSPNLYSVTLTLDVEGRCDLFETRIGFRTCEFKADGFYLNGEKLQIMGLNRHQAYPYVGYAVPKRGQEKDADILKKELHVNLVRTSHYPQSIHFLNRCDEIGLLVFEEIPGWQHVGNEAWQMVALKNVEEMIVRDWNHPSIIIWGVRVNESADYDAFYTGTNACARLLDATRQTGGVRYFEGSHLLEDVYTMNDFAHCGGEMVLRDQKIVTKLEENVPYLITEYNGHMYPTKKFDCEERQMEHVLRHLKVQNAAYADAHISGAIGWCAFDYNTHKDFGAGDRICYHGVMDMFRLPKFAAAVYGSQVSPEVEPILVPVTYWARGERSIGGVLPLVVLSNCDEITVQFGEDTPISVNQKEASLSALPYPPFIVDEKFIPPSKIGEWGMKWEDACIRGYVGGKEVVMKRLSKNPVPTTLSLVMDDDVLSAVEKDTARGVICVRDQCGNPLPFYDAIVRIKVSGPARLLGPSETVIKGGSIGFWIETGCEVGKVTVEVEVEGLDGVSRVVWVK